LTIALPSNVPKNGSRDNNLRHFEAKTAKRKKLEGLQRGMGHASN